MNHKQVCIIVPVHNRREVTRNCLHHLKKLGCLDKYHLIVIDDGSSDGTSEMITEQFSEVTLLKGNGSLWWTGAIVKGMKYAQSLKVEYYIWLNDDTIPLPSTLETLVENCIKFKNLIASAQCYSSSKTEYPTYGGHRKNIFGTKLFYTPPHSISECDCLSGNIVCFPISVVDAIGYPNARKMPHCSADVVYTWKAKKAGFDLKVIGDALAICPFNPYEEGWLGSEISMIRRWQTLLTLKSSLYPPVFWFVCCEFHGFLAPLIFPFTYLKLIFISIVRIILPRNFSRWLMGLKRMILRSDNSFECSFYEKE